MDNATVRWKDGVEFIVFMDPEISPELEDDLRRQLVDSPEVSGFTYIDKDEAYAEVQDLLGDSPELVEVITPERLPASFRVKPTDTLPERVDELADRLPHPAREWPGWSPPARPSGPSRICPAACASG